MPSQEAIAVTGTVNADTQRKRGRPPMAPAQPTPEAPAPGTTTLYVLRDKLNGLYVDEHNLLNPLDLAQFWTTRELANAFRISGKRPDAEEVVPITLTVGDPC